MTANWFARARYGQLVTVRDINLGFVTELLKHLRDERKNNNDTIAKRLEGLRAVIRYAIHEGYDVEDPFGRYSNIIPSDTSHKTVFLDTEEYSRFCNLRLPANAPHAMRLAHKMFIFSCETGLRYSDMQDLRWEHLLMDDKGRYTALEKEQVKTSHTVHVPLSDCALAIVCMNEHNRKGEYVFDRVANQTLNDQLKSLRDGRGLASTAKR